MNCGSLSIFQFSNDLIIFPFSLSPPTGNNSSLMSAPSIQSGDVEPPNPQWYQQNPVGFTAGKSASDHVLAMGLLLKPSEFEELRTTTRTLCTKAQLLNKKYVKQSAKTHRDKQLADITESLQPTFSLNRVPDQTWLRCAILTIFTKLNSNDLPATSNTPPGVPRAASSPICKHRSASAITTVGEVMGWVLRHGSSTEPVRAFIYDYCVDRTKYSSQEARGLDIDFKAWFSHEVRECGKIDETSEELVWWDHYDNQVHQLDLENFVLAINEAIALGQRNLPFLIRPIGSEVGREELCASTFSPTNLIREASTGRAARYVLYLSAFPSNPQHMLTPLRPEKTIVIFAHTRTIPARPAVPARSPATNPPPSASLPVGGVAPFTGRDLDNEQDSAIDNHVSESSAGFPDSQDQGLPSPPDSNPVLPDAPEPLFASTSNVFQPNGTGSQGSGESSPVKSSRNWQPESRMPERPQSLPPRPCAAHRSAPRARSLSPALSHLASTAILFSDHHRLGRPMIPTLSPDLLQHPKVFSRLPKSPLPAGKLSRCCSPSLEEDDDDDVRPAKRIRASLEKRHRTPPPISPSAPHKRRRLVRGDDNAALDSLITSPEPPAATLEPENVGEGDIVDFATFGRTDGSNEVAAYPALQQL
jgi:hypothetical protein